MKEANAPEPPRFKRESHVFKSPKLKRAVHEAVEFFEKTPLVELPPPPFSGTGVYALYYYGDYELYRSAAEATRQGRQKPIYVGKAVPAGWRAARRATGQSAGVRGRLLEHSRSIRQGEALDPADFRCRFTILEDLEADLLVPLESELIRRYEPVWNSVVDGFGNHDPGTGRYEQAPSEWDLLHPGRPWVDRLKGRPHEIEAVRAKVLAHLGTK
ncbi:MAG: Eco29kI family restriction endonuclease [bacterium]